MERDPTKNPEGEHDPKLDTRSSRPTRAGVLRPLKLVGIACVAAALMIIAIRLIEWRAQSNVEEHLKATQEEVERDLPNVQEIKRAWDDVLAEKISWDEYHRIERKVKARRINENDLKQAQDDYNAGHIGIGELHRIQREVRDREP